MQQSGWRRTDVDDEDDVAVQASMKQIWVKEQMRARIRDFSCESSLKVFCGTWNVNTRKLLSEEDDQISSNLDEWLCQSEFSNSCDIYAIGFQEIIDLSTVNVVITTQKSIERAGYWKTKIVETLSKFPGQNFSLVAEKSLVGLLVFVFCRDSLVSHIRDVRTASLPTGVLGIMGNKGSTCISFDVHLTSFCFVCTHFHADRDAVLIRNADFHNILENTELIRNKNSIARKDDVSFRSKWWYDEGSNISKIMDHDHVFWFGDLNYRINGSVPMDVVFAKVVVDDWRSLREVDQLNEERLRGAVFAEFHEGDIAFAPTYKFQPGSSQYEQRSDKKLRAPAWCDRILWKVAKESEKSKSNSRSWVKQLSYRSVPMKSSDHRPVLASFECSIAEGIHEKERAVYQDLLNVLDKWENAIAPRIEVPVRFLDFGEVRYMTSVSQTLEIRNIGGVIAKWNFVPKMDEASVSKSCIRFAPISGVMSPGETMFVTITMTMDADTWAEMVSNNTAHFDDIVVLRVWKGSDFFVVLSGEVNATSVQEYEAAMKAAEAAEAEVDLVDIYSSKEKIASR